jgi:hypothetical protein
MQTTGNNSVKKEWCVTLVMPASNENKIYILHSIWDTNATAVVIQEMKVITDLIGLNWSWSLIVYPSTIFTFWWPLFYEYVPSEKDKLDQHN